MRIIVKTRENRCEILHAQMLCENLPHHATKIGGQRQIAPLVQLAVIQAGPLTVHAPALHIAANKPMYALNLTARGMYGTGIEFFDIGRRRIVKSFERLTTEHMHAYWRKKKR